MTIFRSTSAVVLSALALAACGGDDAPTKADVITEADKICADGNKELEAIGNPTSIEEVPDFAKRSVPIVESTVDKIEALEAPEEGKADFDTFVKTNRDAIALVKPLGDADPASDGPAIEEAITEADAVGTKGEEAAKAYGFKECGKEGGI